LNKNTLIRIVQLVIAIGILVLLFAHMDIENIRDLLRHAMPSYVLLAFIVLVLQLLVATYRWFMILKIAGFSPPLWQCIGLFSTSSLINTTIPGGINGDILRTWLTVRNGVPSSISAYTVICDRIINLTALGLPVTVMLLPHLIWRKEHFLSVDIFALGVASMLLGVLASLALAAPVMRRLNVRLPTLLTPIIGISQMLCDVFQNKQQTLILSGTIVLGYVLQILAVVFLGSSLGITLPFQALIIGIPVVLLLSAIPITPGGWGIRESIMVLVLKEYHIAPEAALGLSILFGIGSIVSSLPTALSWFLSKSWSNKSQQASVNSGVT
jgi:uncharacterized protein (TIRG00374 family)